MDERTEPDIEPTAPALGPNQVMLGKRLLDLVLPASYAVRHEIVVAAGTNPNRGFAAALGVCCARIAKMEGMQGVKYDYQPLVYGGRIIDALIGTKQVTMAEIQTAGIKAYDMIVDSLVTEDEVKRAEGNSEARKAG